MDERTNEQRKSNRTIRQNYALGRRKITQSPASEIVINIIFHMTEVNALAIKSV